MFTVFFLNVYNRGIFLRDLSSVKKMIQPDNIDLINSINDDCACVEDIKKPYSFSIRLFILIFFLLLIQIYRIVLIV